MTNSQVTDPRTNAELLQRVKELRHAWSGNGTGDVAANRQFHQKGGLVELAELSLLLASRLEEADKQNRTLRDDVLHLGRNWKPVHCDKCGHLVPNAFTAIELKDGGPIDDPAGFNWCIVCHCQRVSATLTAERDALKEEVETLGSAYDARVKLLREECATVRRLTEENERLHATNKQWLHENATGGWIDDLRKQVERVRKLREAYQQRRGEGLVSSDDSFLSQLDTALALDTETGKP